MQEQLRLLRNLVPALWRYRWSALFAAVLAGGLGGAIALKIPNRYDATARVFVDTDSILKPLMQGLTVQPNVEQQVQIVARTLISQPNVARVIEMTGLDRTVETPAQRETLTQHLLKKIRFRPTDGRNVYEVIYTGRSQDESFRVVDALLSIFMEHAIGDKRRDAEQARDFIDEQLRDYAERLNSSEQSLKEFKLANLEVMPNLTEDYISIIGQAKKDLQTAQLSLRQALNTRDALQRQTADEPPTFISESPGAPRTAARRSDNEQRLLDNRRRLDDLLLQYTDAHPDVIRLRRIVDDLEQVVQRERERESASSQAASRSVVPNRVYQDLKVSLADTEAKIASLRAAVTDAKRRQVDAERFAAAIPEVEARYKQLTRDYEVNKKQYESLLQRRESAQISNRMDSVVGLGRFRVVDPPRAATRPAFPDHSVILGVALVASLAFGVLVAFLRDQVSPVYFDAASLAKDFDIPVLGSVTYIRGAAATLRQGMGVFFYVLAVLVYVGAFGGAIAYLFANPLIA